MFKKIILGIILLAVCRTSFGQDETIPVSSAEKFNKRGIYNNSDLSFNGQEIISDYDGNLMIKYSTPLNFSNDLSDELTLIYNSNVEHRIFRESGNGYSINVPEWIIGYKGFALQTLNFETNESIPFGIATASGQQVPLLISGYHFTNPDEVFPARDHLTILKSDGSKLILENVKDWSTTGLYVEKGKNTFGYATVIQNGITTRVINYKPGDGCIYTFFEELIKLGTNEGPLKAIYLKYISSVSNNIKIEFLYDHLDYNLSKLGRKTFSGMCINNRISYFEEYTWELKTNYSFTSNTAFINIINYNSDESLNLLASKPDNLFTTEQEPTKRRILYVNQITDQLGRKDIFNYNDNVTRLFILGEPNELIIDYKFILLNESTSHSKKKTTYEYYDQLFSQAAPDLILDLRYGNYFILSNIEAAERDCFTNFMLKKKNALAYENSNYKPILTTSYTYFKEGGNGNIRTTTSHDIITEITTVNQLPQNENITIQSPKKILKNFSRYAADKILIYALDPSSTIKLMSEEIINDLGENSLVKTSFTYDIGVFISDDINRQWNGSFLELSDTTQKYDLRGESYKTFKYRNLNEIQFDSLKFFDDIYTLPKSIKTIIKKEKWYDPKGLVTEKTYNNFLSNVTYSDITPSNASNYFHRIGLLDEEHIYSGDITKSMTKYEYYPITDAILKTKLQNVTNSYNIRPVTTSFNYYGAADGLRLQGMTVSKSLDGKFSEEYRYPNGEATTLDKNIITTAQGIVVDDLGNKTTEFLSHSGFSLTPFSTTVKFSNGTTLGSFITANNRKEKPDFEIDLNGYYSKFEYDNLGRLTKAVLPGNYQKEFDDNVLYEYNPLTITYNDNASGQFPLTAVEKKWLSGSKFLDTQIDFDSFGRLCKTSVRNDAGTLEEKSLKEYDYLGRVVKETRGGSYTHYNNYNVVGDLLNVTNADGSVKTNTYHYGQGTIGDQTYYVQITAKDETGKTKTSYYDQVGNLLAEQLGTNNPTLFYYDSIYRLTKVKTPEGIETTYQYDQNSNVIYKHSPDFGTYRYAYDRFDRLRFQLHVESQEFVFNNYDPLDRILYTGVINNYNETTFNTLNADSSNSFESDANNLVVVNQYDSFAQSGVFVDQNLPAAFAFENPIGRLTASAYRDKPGQTWNYKLYSYDHLGRIKDQYLVE